MSLCWNLKKNHHTHKQSSRRSLEYSGGNNSSGGGGNYGHTANRYEGGIGGGGGGGSYHNTSIRRHEVRGNGMMSRNTTYRISGGVGGNDDSMSPRSRERNMGPPKSIPPRRFRGGGIAGAPSSTYRGRGSISSTRGVTRRSIGGIVSARSSSSGGAATSSSAALTKANDLRVRRKLIALKAESLRKLKIAKLRR